MKCVSHQLISQFFFCLLITAFIIPTIVTGEENLEKKSSRSSNQISRQKLCRYLANNQLEAGSSWQTFASFYTFKRKKSKLYIWAYIAKYNLSNGKIRMQSGMSAPFLIEISKKGNIEHHWEPPPDHQYTQSIKNKFPLDIHDDILNFQSKHNDILSKLKNTVESKAKKTIYSSMDTYTLHVGEVKTIELKANITTGFRWHYTIGDNNILKVIKERYREDKSDQSALGGGGRRVLYIKGIKPGATTLSLAYYQDWNSSDIEKTKHAKFLISGESENPNNIPESLDLEFISIPEWKTQIHCKYASMPQFEVQSGELQCNANMFTTESENSITSKYINQQHFCSAVVEEGAAGTLYKTYHYATYEKNNVITVHFVAAYPQCENFPKHKRIKCEKESATFFPDALVYQVVHNLVSRQCANPFQLSPRLANTFMRQIQPP